jgi:hypothetical protein
MLDGDIVGGAELRVVQILLNMIGVTFLHKLHRRF